jgi:hypothetical protein
MKKLFVLFFLIIFILSCSKDSDETRINPSPSPNSYTEYTGGDLIPKYGYYEAIDSSEAFVNEGKFQLLLHDTLPQGSVDAINVDIMEIRIVPENGDIITVMNNPIKFNLLDFKKDNPIEMVNTRVPTGRYCQIRFMYAENQTIRIFSC